jgi:cysteine-rich repeat protein
MRHASYTLPLLLLLLAPAPAAAQGPACGPGDFPCGYQLKDHALLPAPTLFRLQARVAQAGVMIGEASFARIQVQVMGGAEVLCVERFDDVRVKASVMNLEIGREIDCELDEVLAQNTDLRLQVCVGNEKNCLDPIPLSATPYAVRATWAWTAGRAHEADVAAQSHYAHRFTADKDLPERNTLGTGYFDLQTPTPEAAAPVYDAERFAAYSDSGFLQWTPVRSREAFTMQVSGKNHGSERLADLDEVVLSARLTRTERGDMEVQPRSPTGLTVTGRGAHVTGDSKVDGDLLVKGPTTVEKNLVVVTDGALEAELLVGTGATFDGASLKVTGDSEILGHLKGESPATVTGGAQVTGDSEVLGMLSVTAAADAAVVSGNMNVLGSADVDALHGLGAAEATTSITATTAELEGGATLGVLGVGGRMKVEGDVVFKDLVTFMGGHSKPEQGPQMGHVQYENEDRALTFSAKQAWIAGAAAGSHIDGGMNRLNNARLQLAAAPPSPCDEAGEGISYVDMTLHTVRLCTGGMWKSLGGGGGGFLCGNAFIQDGEGCDDGNLDPGDGCDASCQVEDGFVCEGQPNVCKPLCGDSRIMGPEGCDDGNLDQDDGCTALCRVAPGWECTGEPSVCTVDCGDGIVLEGEGCDDGNLDPDDGCTPECEVMPGWHCEGRGRSVCSPIPVAVPGYEGVAGPDMTVEGLALCGGAGSDDLMATGKDFYALCEGYQEIVFACSTGDDDEAELVSIALPTDGVVLSDEGCDDWPGAASSPFAGDHVLAVDQSDPGCGDYDNSYEMYVHFGVQWACMGTNTTPGYLGQPGGRIWAFVRYP